MSLLHRTTVFGVCVVATATLSIAPINAKPDDYSFELAPLNSDQSIVTIRLKNKLKNQLVPDALIDCAADVGAQGVTTMTEPMLTTSAISAVDIANEGLAKKT